MPKLADISKYSRALVISLALLLVLGIALATKDKEDPSKPKLAKASACGPYRQDKDVRVNGSVLKAEVVTKPNELGKGLSGRPCILPNQAMLFSFAKPGKYAFWMKDMKFPIDIIWISAKHTVVGIEQDVEPSTYPDRFINKDNPAQYVLELKSNNSIELHITLGTPIAF